MIVDMFLAAAAVVLFVPLLTGYAAYTHGRRFWLWFGLGLVLPVISLAFLTVLLAIRRLDPGERLLDEARRILADDEAQAARARVRAED